MNKKSPLLEASQRLRFRAACNHFKHHVLGAIHVANQPQTETLQDALGASEKYLASRTWQSWFALEPPLPQASKVDLLDKIIKLFKNEGAHPHVFEDMHENFYSELIYGGLLAKLIEPTGAKNVSNIMQLRTLEYESISPLHLHLDAMDAAAWHQDLPGASWEVVAMIASDRILQLLGERWLPRIGSVYDGFTSSFGLSWNKANQNERDEILQSFLKMPSDYFERHMNAGARPVWPKIGIEIDLSYRHIYKLLFALPADSDFLVEDRLNAWALDLATAGLAMHAMSWPDRYETMALGHPPELYYWVALSEIFFNPNLDEIDVWSIEIAMGMGSAHWGNKALDTFMSAREVYLSTLNNFGVKPSEIIDGLEMLRNRYPLFYKLG